VRLMGHVDTDDSNIAWLRGRLNHYRELALDRVELYDVTERERLEYQEHKAIEMETGMR
jgi:hypothetical protein